MKKIILCLFVLSFYTSYSQKLTDSLFAYYPFTGNAIDSSGNGNDGTVTGATLSNDRFGHNNSAYSFDGNDEIRISAAFNGKQPFTTNASICYWIKTNTKKTAAAILAYHSACTNNNNDFLTFYLNNAAGSHYLYNTVYWHSPVLSVDESIVTDNVWHLVSYTYDHDSAKLYIDGTNVQKSSVTPQSGFYFDTNTDLVIGNISNNSCGFDFYFVGAIDDIRLYNRTLSQKEISNIKNNKLGVETTSISDRFIINIYPNPGMNSVSISNIDSDITSIELTDIIGKILNISATELLTSITLDISNYSAGLYNLVFKNNYHEIVNTEKLMITR